MFEDVSIDTINKMTYVDFCAHLGQPNIPPGGQDSIKKVIKEVPLFSNSIVLDSGCNTGYVAREIARSTGSTVIGIDINEEMVRVANSKNGIGTFPGTTKFIQGDSMNLPFPDNYFDLIICGGSTAFMDNPRKAIEQYIEKTKLFGYIAEIEFTYHTNPTDELMNKVNETIGTNLVPYKKSDWKEFIEHNSNVQPYYIYDGLLPEIDMRRSIKYIEYELSKSKIDDNKKEVIKNRWIDIYKVFEENRKFLSYTIFIYRKVDGNNWW